MVRVSTAVVFMASVFVSVNSLTVMAEDVAESPYFQDGKLTQTLEFKDAQGGFAGFSGNLWSISADGAWTKSPFLNATVREPTERGKLTADELKTLADALTKYDLLRLPERIGKPIGANPRVYSLTFGKKTDKLNTANKQRITGPQRRNTRRSTRRDCEPDFEIMPLKYCAKVRIPSILRNTNST